MITSDPNGGIVLRLKREDDESTPMRSGLVDHS